MRKKYESAFGLVFRKKKTPNKHFNLTYLAVTTPCKARLAPAKTQVKCGVRSDSRIWEDGNIRPFPALMPERLEEHPTQLQCARPTLSCFAIQPLHAVVRRRVRRRSGRRTLYAYCPPAIMLPAKSRAFGGKDVSRVSAMRTIVRYMAA